MNGLDRWLSVRILGGLIAAFLGCLSLGVSSATAAASIEPTAIYRLTDTIYEYDYIVSTGGDIHHEVGLHRIVQVQGGQPIVAPNGVFMVHGDIWNFNAAFRGEISASGSVAIFLASKGIDVWGIDLGWTLVPASTTDFSFMKGWGMERDVADVEKALAFARAVRADSGSSADRLTLLAWSHGGFIGYALLNREAQLPQAQRQVRAFVPVDTFIKVADPTVRKRMCAFKSAITNDINHGIYAYSEDFYARVGRLAQNHPDDPSPLLGAGYTNRQASLATGAATAQTFGPSVAPYYHFVAGTFPQGNINKIPTGLVFTDFSRWNNFLTSGSPFEADTGIRDAYAAACTLGNTAFDNDLDQVTVPVFYIGAGGGFGREGLYSLTLLGSKDRSSYIVSFYPPDQSALDFGHVDLFAARDAEQLVWTPIWNWLVAHPPPQQ